MDALELLTRQHEETERAFAAFEALGPSDTSRKQELARQVVHDLSVHASIEEQVFYPTLRQALPALESEIEQDLREHREVEELLATLDDALPDDPRFDGTFRDVAALVRRHVEEEESTLFPTVKRAFNAAELDDLGQAMEALARIAPTRPHPRAPQQPLLNMLVGAAAGAFDRVRDAARRLREEAEQSDRPTPH